MALTDTLQLQHHWLPTLSNIVTDDDSFSRDLMKQFDKKRSRLIAEMAGDNASISSDSCISRRTRTPESVPNVPQISINNHPHNDDASSINIRRRSAGDLLRRSSAYLRAKFEAYKQSKHDSQQHDNNLLTSSEEQNKSVFRSWSLSKKNQPKSLTTHIENNENNENNENDAVDQQNNNKQKKKNNIHLSSSAIDSLSSSSFSSSTSLPPKKIAVNTTILIPPPQHQPYQYATVQPPVITQYPPRPLKYSPVHPIIDEKLIHKNQQQLSNHLNNNNIIQSRGINNNDNNDNNNKSHHHRISLPIFKLIHESPPPSLHSRRSSESDIHISSSQYNNNSFTKLTKRFSYWLGCQPSKLSKKGKERAKEIVEEKNNEQSS